MVRRSGKTRRLNELLKRDTCATVLQIPIARRYATLKRGAGCALMHNPLSIQDMVVEYEYINII